MAKNKKKLMWRDSIVVVAFIGLLGTIITSIANPELLKLLLPDPTLTPTIIMATQSLSTATFSPPSPTIPPTATATATFTFTPTKTHTPKPTVTEFYTATPTVHPTSIPGQDWLIDCIDLYTWQTYLDGDGSAITKKCSQLAKWGITAQDGELFLLSFESQSTAKEYGLITKLPTRTTIEIDIEVERLRNSEVWVGIFDADRSEQFSGFVFVIQPGSSMDFREMPLQKPIVNNQYYTYVDEYFPIVITLDVGKISVAVNKNKLISNHPLYFTNRELFIGYRSLPNTEIDVSISGLNIAVP